MIYQLSLQTTGLAAGILLLLSHTLGLWKPEATMKFARSFPRSRFFGTLFLFLAAAWSFVLVTGIDLGEFSPLRNIMLVGIFAGAVLSWMFAEEFLAVRSLGMLLLLAAEPLLESAALRDESSRLLLVLLAYVWILGGLFLVGMPYLLRDVLDILTARRFIWRTAALAGLIYGVALIATAVFFW